ncbi:MAG TPA: DNA polymerase III subunit alpha, partial [Bacillota bacterium]|nr:DNA polymerase III subunit alpha [Bacillota bacterium]
MSNHKFVHLHCHTEYSLLDGAARIKELVRRAADMEMPAVAITDHGAMFGVIDFYKEALKAGVKPLIGCEVYVAPRSRQQKEPKLDDYQYHLVLLAENQTGYRNLMRIVSAGYLEGFYYQPRVDHELLAKNAAGLIALSGCLGGEIPSLLKRGEDEAARNLAVRYRDIFGPGNFYLELQDHRLPEQVAVNKGLSRIARETGIELVVTNDVHYLSREDAALHDVLLCIQTGKTVHDTDRLKFETEEFYFKSAPEMAMMFKDHPEALQNTLRIAERCRVDFQFDQLFLPAYDVPEGKDAAAYLEELCREGLQQRYPEITEQLEQRLAYEMKIINQMGYANYFLIVWDLIKYARSAGVMVGPGRGSAAGSLVAYCLGITNIDPIGNALLFERFLNPDRVSMPDIDIDFCDDKRERVFSYVAGKYGAERVAQIITFGTMAARGAVRDVGRALAFPYGEVDRVAKMIPNEIGMTINRALEQNRELQALYRGEERYRQLLDSSMAVEGMPRHASIHAAGVVISRDPLVNHVPLLKTNDQTVVTQFPMGTLEQLGLLKMDFLGLKTLSIIEEALAQIRRRHGREIILEEIPLDDAATYRMLSQGESTGIFQLESSGMRNVLRELMPNKFADIVAVVALYRPGPMEQIPAFIDSKHGRKPIHYPHPDLEPILKETYGVIVYQEQIMEIAATMAGFTLAQADLLRRAIGKKNKEILDQQQDLFIQGCMKKGYSRSLAREIYDLILKFASYGFNKSHAAAYALIAYQTAYLKANYPVEYMASLMTGYCSSSDKVALYIADCRRQGIEVLPPDINESEINFTVIDDKNIRFGLAAVKNVGTGAIESILEARRAKPFVSLRDFSARVDGRLCNRKAVESLIKCGAFDSLGGHRAQYLACLEESIAGGQVMQRER